MYVWQQPQSFTVYLYFVSPSAGGATAGPAAVLRMDSEIQRDGRVLDLTDDAWREDKLPYEDVTIPLVHATHATVHI